MPSKLQTQAPFASHEEFLAALQQDAGGLISFVDTEERLRFATARFAQWLGKPLEDILGRSLAELYEPAAYKIFAKPLRAALAGEAMQYEREAKLADGSSNWVSVNLRPCRDASGAIVGVFACALEVKELKRTHDALGNALEEIASHIENTPLAMVEWTSALRIKRWSPQAEALFGWSLEEVRGKRAPDF